MGGSGVGGGVGGRVVNGKVVSVPTLYTTAFC